MWISHEGESGVVVLADHVRPGSRAWRNRGRAGLPLWCGKQRLGQLVQEIGIGLAEFESDLVGVVIDEHPMGQIAHHLVPDAGRSSDDVRQSIVVSAHGQLLLQAHSEVGGFDHCGRPSSGCRAAA